MATRLLRRAARARYNRVLAASIVTPKDAPAVTSGAGAAVRVLLLGSGVASGQGVSTYGLALVGALQRTLQVQLGRPVDVELVRQHGASISQAAHLARGRAAEDWDAYVLAYGVSDALRLTPPELWLRGLGLLLSTIEDVKPSPLQVPIVVAGIPPLSSFAAHHGLLLPLLARHAVHLNEATRRLVRRHPAATFAALPEVQMTGERPYGSPSAYDEWAAALALQLVPRLRAVVHRLPAQTDGEEGPTIARTLLRPVNLDARDRLRACMERTRALLAADFAAVRLLEGDELWSVADSERSHGHRLPIEQTVCAVTMVEGIAHVPDLASDPRFAHLSLGAGYGVRSYSGTALRGVDGEVIGTLCVLNGGGRLASTEVLRAAGREVERELHALSDQRAGTTPVPSSAAPSQEVRGAAVEDPALEEPALEEPATELRSVPSWWRRRVLLLQHPTRLRTEGSRLAEMPLHRPRPAQQHFSIPGPQPVRILTVGGEYGIGYGVTDRQHALDGALARLIHRRTGRGIEIVNRADDTPGLTWAGSTLGPGGADGFHLVIWTPTFREATRAWLRVRWTIGIGGLVRRVRATSDAAVVLMGFPTLVGHQPLAVLGRIRARRINAVLGRIALRAPGVTVALPSPIVLSDVSTVDGAATYREAAVHMFDAVMEALDSAATEAVPVAGRH